MSIAFRVFVVSLLFGWSVNLTLAAEPRGELAKRLAGVTFDHYAQAPGYSEGPTWRNGDVFFCSGGLLRVNAQKQVSKYLEIGPAGTVLRADGHLLIADNKFKAVLDLAPDGKLGVIVDRIGTQPLRGLNDLTVDARGNIYWTDPTGSSLKEPIGDLYRVQPNGRVDRIGSGLAFPNGIEVDPESKFLYVIESQSKKILRYALPEGNDVLGQAEVFYDLDGSGGDGCAFDAAGNLWVADFHRPETKLGRITVLSPQAEVLAYLPLPSKVVSNIAFGGPHHDEIFCTTGDPPGVFHAKVGVKGFAGHPGVAMPNTRVLNVVPLREHVDAASLRKMAQVAAEAKLFDNQFSSATLDELKSLIAGLADAQIRIEASKLIDPLQRAAVRHAQDRVLLAEVKRHAGKATLEGTGPRWLREIAGDDALAVFSQIVELDLNERTDGHKAAVPKPISARVNNDTLAMLAGQDALRRLELSGTAVTSEGLVHLKDLKALEILNICLTACDDRGFEHLAGLTNMKRMVVCASKITGSGFKHLGGMKQLESINLHSAPASDEGLQAIGQLSSLRRLEIVHTKVTDAGLKHVANLTNLRQLHVHGPETTPTALPFIGQLKELYELDVYDKAASNETIQQIAGLSKLRLLMLVNGVFDDEGVKSLSKLTTLESLALHSNKMTDAAVESLFGLTNLRKLNIGGTKITAEGRKRLAERLPKLVISP